MYEALLLCHVVPSAKAFDRWIDWSCVSAPPVTSTRFLYPSDLLNSLADDMFR